MPASSYVRSALAALREEFARRAAHEAAIAAENSNKYTRDIAKAPAYVPPWAPAPQPQLAQPVESRMLQALYRGYAGDYDAAKAAQDAGLVYATPQRAAAEAYARNRVKQAARRGDTAEPHVEMVLIDPATGRRYGHSTLGTGAQGPIRTLAAELQPEEVVSTTNLYAHGGLAQYKECSCGR